MKTFPRKPPALAGNLKADERSLYRRMTPSERRSAAKIAYEAALAAVG